MLPVKAKILFYSELLYSTSFYNVILGAFTLCSKHCCVENCCQRGVTHWCTAETVSQPQPSSTYLLFINYIFADRQIIDRSDQGGSPEWVLRGKQMWPHLLPFPAHPPGEVLTAAQSLCFPEWELTLSFFTTHGRAAPVTSSLYWASRQSGPKTDIPPGRNTLSFIMCNGTKIL